MTANWGLKISRPGASVLSSDPRNLMLSTNYQMFKYHNVYNTSTTFTPGDTSKTVSVTHGLGYVPAFIPYVFRGDTNVLEMIPDYTYGTDYDTSIQAYADTDKIYFKVDMGLTTGTGWNEVILSAGEVQNDYFGNVLVIGKYPSLGSQNSAIRFTGVPLSSSSSLNSVILKLYSGGRGGSSGNRIKWDTYGIDEDNTSSLFSGSPYGRARTTATDFKDINYDEVANGSFVDINVASIVNEIVNRGAWSQNNAMGFTMIENGSTADTYFSSLYADQSKLRIRYNGNATFDFKAIVFIDKISA